MRADQSASAVQDVSDVRWGCSIATRGHIMTDLMGGKRTFAAVSAKVRSADKPDQRHHAANDRSAIECRIPPVSVKSPASSGPYVPDRRQKGG
jgi:hypothetical protein